MVEHFGIFINNHFTAAPFGNQRCLPASVTGHHYRYGPNTINTPDGPIPALNDLGEVTVTITNGNCP
jgi:hypothetical protein